ncbi:MAG TPA: rhodanese-related sulfurtransferase [Pseudomonadales bacterium]|nr:rhodanese-related sulfurtransferase [Pseudomonadales bacterium]
MNVATFYRFVRIEDPHELAASLRARCTELELVGTIVLAHEGINATLAGSADALERCIDALRADARFADVAVRHSRGTGDEPIFYRLKVGVRRELIAMHRAGVDPVVRTGEHVGAAEWNRLLDDPDVTVIDARNAYEIELGTFPGAVDPGTRSFREFPAFADGLDPATHRRVAMFCTGGIRCEKASAYLLGRGFEAVYQLDGGILNYIDTVGADNRFVGECFVFDRRVALDDSLDRGGYRVCHACRHALSEADVQSPSFVVDVSCPHCIDRQTDRQRASFAERARQAKLAAARGERHVGAAMPAVTNSTSRTQR